MARAISSGQPQEAEPALALLEAVALIVYLQDVDVVGEPVQQRAGQPFRPENFGLLLKRQVASHQG